MQDMRFLVKMLLAFLSIASSIPAVSIVRQSDPFSFPTGVRHGIRGTVQHQMLSCTACGKDRRGLRIAWSLSFFSAGSAAVSLYTASGALVERIEVSSADGHATVRRNLTKGIYFVQLTALETKALSQMIAY
jgi:hypothetical protein